MAYDGGNLVEGEARRLTLDSLVKNHKPPDVVGEQSQLKPGVRQKGG